MFKFFVCLYNIHMVSSSKSDPDFVVNRLIGRSLPAIILISSSGEKINLAGIKAKCVIFCFPRVSNPTQKPIENWATIPGAKGCTAQNKMYESMLEHFQKLSVEIFGMSTQTPDQLTAAENKLGLSFPLLSDSENKFLESLEMPTTQPKTKLMLKRLTLIIDKQKIVHVQYPVLSPEHDSENAFKWIRSNLNA